MAYILESEEEFRRLERQSQNPAYDFRAELEGMFLAPGSRILDAGCGSGVVTRYLGAQHPDAEIVGCDLSQHRVKMARKAVTDCPNVSFERANLSRTPFETGSFHCVISRYVFQHLSPDGARSALKEFRRILKPGGQLRLIDGDGLFINLYPQSAAVSRGLKKMASLVDFSVGRKLPSLMREAGFQDIEWRIRTTDHNPVSRATEVGLMRERLTAAARQLEALMGKRAAREFSLAYLQDLEACGSTYFTQTFVVQGSSGQPPETGLVKPRRPSSAGVR